MASYKETPRQKMIAMMYLVLTALLALNVSKEILDAFLVVNESMETTNEKFAKKIDETYSEFQKQYTINTKKVEDYWFKAKEARKLSQDMVKYLDSIKFTVISKTEGITMAEAAIIPLAECKKKDDFNRPTYYFIGSEYNGEAYTIKKKINEYKQNILKIIEEEHREFIEQRIGLITDGEYRSADGMRVPWERHNFYHTILAADITILNKIIAEVYNAESDVITYLYKSISAEDFKFNKVGAKVIPNSNYIFLGDEYKAEVLVAAYDTTQNPEVYVIEGSDTLTMRNLGLAKQYEGKEGMVELTFPASTEGTKKYAGIIRMVTPLGDTNNYHFSHEYIVAKPSATISPTKMNVFYRGVDNPVLISASGTADAHIRPDITAGSIIRETEGWVVKNLPSNAINTTIKIYADDKGDRKFMGEQLFRIKKLPDPLAKIMGVKEGKISKKKLLANTFLVCQLPEWVDFEYKFKVTSFTMIIPLGGGYVTKEKSEDQKFNQKMKDMIQTLKKNDVILFQDIKVRGPEGPRKIESITITLN
ncbi:MAG: gliding motility protein GldM [Bacteroidales bacterium]|nr:gliding motility protein GldM [Bacteroidales bacterium]